MYHLSSRLYKWTRTTTGSELGVAKARREVRGGSGDRENFIQRWRLHAPLEKAEI